jgi:hypothetical protein
LPEAWPKLYTDWQTLNITYKPAQETLLATPQTLPTSEPATPQISYTIQESDLPTLSLTPKSKKWCAIVYVGGKFVTAGTIYGKLLKNGASVEESNGSIPANVFWTKGFRCYDIQIGDVLDVKLWSSVTDSNWDYKALHVTVSRIILASFPKQLRQVQITVDRHPKLTLGNPYAYTMTYVRLYFEDAVVMYAPDIPSTHTFQCLYMGDDYGIYRIGIGDFGTGLWRNNSTYRPYYDYNVTPTKLVLRGINV